MNDYYIKELERNGGTSVDGVLIVFDEDKDTRVVNLIKTFPHQILKNLFMAYESEGNLSLVWRDHDSPRIEGSGIEADIDYWTMEHEFLPNYSDTYKELFPSITSLKKDKNV